MDKILTYVALFGIVCIVWFFITRLWVALVDSVAAGIKKLFSSGKEKNKNSGI